MSADSSRRMMATLTGRVQGVGFRWYVQRVAERLDVVGWVENRGAGVDVLAEGSQAVLDELLLALWEGPPGSSVDDVSVRYEPARNNLTGFAIRSGEHRGD